MDGFKWIRVTEDIHKKLTELGKKDETYNSIIETLLERVKVEAS